MKRLLLLLAAIHIIGRVTGQQIDLSGQISIQNSEYKTGKRQFVKDAQIRAPFIKPAISDAQGEFTLTFVGVGAGEGIRLSVTHSKYVVVNHRDLNDVILGRKPLLHIYMSTESELFESQDSLYHIADEVLRSEYNKKIAILKQKNYRSEQLITSLRNELNTKVIDAQSATEALKSKYEEALKKSREFAQELASVNLDDASNRYKKSFELWKRGKIDSALLVLDENKIELDYQKSVHDRAVGQQLIHQGELLYNQTIQELKLKQKLYEQKLQYFEARLIIEKILLILEAEKGDKDFEVQSLRISLSSYYHKSEKEKAYNLLKKILIIAN
jgi:uncharacterized protein YdcH (DUF465 family)